MPSRLLLRVLRAPSLLSSSSSPLAALSAPLPFVRALSSTSALAAAPPNENPPPARQSPSSASNILSMDDRKKPSGQRPRTVARPGEAAAIMLNRINSKQQNSKLDSVESFRNTKISGDYLRQMPRRWAAGDVYSPHDLSPVEMQKWRKRSLRKNDVVDVLGIRPLDMYKNFSLVQEFTTSSGQIIHSAGTSLRPVNQRKIAKMIRRVQGMGIYPTIHDHPEMIRDRFFP
ncbi:hypothetical protein E4U21_004067 [Claviceps maximensis]|nr:hypothetical protein E4U21_004067 [Claviceps maximensis]